MSDISLGVKISISQLNNNVNKDQFVGQKMFDNHDIGHQ